jgi:hypothetical protein
MPYIGNTPALDYISYAVQNFTVTAGTTSYALDYSVANENDIRLVINNVIQRPGASFAYSATGTTLTLTSATLATDTMYAVFIGRAVQTVTPPANINIQLADGTAAAPSLNFANDTNTGIFRPTTDEIALTEGGVEGMRLNASGNVQFAKNISIGGATPTTSGFGITFPASASASTDANTLDDYEEGTWTPIYYGTSTAGTTTYTNRGGTYRKIGSIVFVEANIQWSSATGTGQGYIGGLPFTTTSNSPTDSKGFVAIAAWNGYSITGTVFAIPSPSATNFELYAINNGSLASSSVQGSGAIRFEYYYIAA